MKDIGKVAIIGAGPVGCATAAFVKASGHAVSLYSPTAARLDRSNGRVRYKCTGALEAEIDIPFLDAPEKLADADVVLVCIPADLYAPILAPLRGIWRDGQTVIVSGALSLCPLWLAQAARARGVDLQVAGWGTTCCTARIKDHALVQANPLRKRIDMAHMREAHAPDADAICRALLGERFVLADNMLAPALANINPIAHAAEVIPNLSRIDRAERWSLFGCFNQSVGALAEALDAERLAVANAFGFDLPTLRVHYANSYGVAEAPLHEMAAAIDAGGMSPNGPVTLVHRYIVEDGPFGMAFLEALGRLAGVATPTLSASITLLGVVSGRDLRAENLLVDEIGLAGMDAKTLRRKCAA